MYLVLVGCFLLLFCLCACLCVMYLMYCLKVVIGLLFRLNLLNKIICVNVNICRMVKNSPCLQFFCSGIENNDMACDARPEANWSGKNH